MKMGTTASPWPDDAALNSALTLALATKLGLVTKKNHFEGREYCDDRLFVLELAHVTTRSLTQADAPIARWAVITRRNAVGFPPSAQMTLSREKKRFNICTRSRHKLRASALAAGHRSQRRLRFECRNGRFWRSQFCTEMARPERFELPTPKFVVWCSIQLSYGRLLRIAREMIPDRPRPAEAAFPYRLRLPLASLPPWPVAALSRPHAEERPKAASRSTRPPPSFETRQDEVGN